jgi:hypothetical protein
MITEFFYPIAAAEHDLPAGMNDFSGAGSGANKNDRTAPSGGRAGPMSHDDATSYTTVTGEPTQQAYNVSWPSLVASIASITLAFRHCAIAAVGIQRKCAFVNAAGTFGTTIHTSYDNSTTWATQGPSDASSGRPGGGSWVAADVANDMTQFIVAFTDLDIGTLAVTSVWGELGYEIPSGGFAFLLGLAALAPSLVGFDQLEKLAAWRTLYHPRHTVWAAGELMKAWADIQSYNWPTYFY